MIYFISRHQGAIDWIRQQSTWSIDHFVSHLNPEAIQPGDVVIGTLPLHLAAAVCARGAKFYFLSLNVGFADRGGEYSATEMEQLGCHLQQFEVKAIPSTNEIQEKQ